MRVLIFSVVLALGGCSLVYGTGDLRDQDASVSVDVGPDGSADTRPPIDVGPEVDAGPEMDAGPEVDAGPNVDSGCVLQLPTSTDWVFEAGWPAQATLSFAPLNCSGSLVIADDVRMVDTQSVVMGQMSLTFTYARRIPLFGEATTFQLYDQDDPSNSTSFTVSLPPSVEEFVPTGLGPLSWVFSPSMDVANDGTAVFATNDRRFTSNGPLDESNIILWRLAGPGTTDSVNITEHSDGQMYAPRISDDAELVVYANRSANGYEYRRTGARGMFDVPGVLLADSGQPDVRQTSDGYYVSLLYDRSGERRVFEFAGPASEFDGPIGDAQEVANALGGSHPIADVSSQNGVAIVNPSNEPEFVSTQPPIVISSDCTVDVSRSRVDVRRDEEDDAAFAFVGTCESNASALFVGNDRLPLAAPPTFDGLVTASDDMSVLLLSKSNVVSGLDHFMVARQGPGDLLEFRPLNMASEVPVPRFDAAAISPNGRWAVYALASASTMRMMRVLVFDGP